MVRRKILRLYKLKILIFKQYIHNNNNNGKSF